MIPGDHKIHVTSNDLIVCPSSKLIFIEEKCKSLKVLNNFLFFTLKEITLNFVSVRRDHMIPRSCDHVGVTIHKCRVLTY